MREHSLVSGRQVLKLKILCFIFCLWTSTDLRGSFARSSLQTVQRVCTTCPAKGTGTLPSCLQHTELCNVQSWFTHISGPADNFWVSWKSSKLGYKNHLIYWRASLPDEGPFSNSKHKTDLHRFCHKHDKKKWQKKVCLIALQEGDVQRPEEKAREYHDNFFQGWRQHFKLE